MKIRVMGSKEECAEFSAMIRNNVDVKYIKSISKFFPNTRAGEFSTEGRVYIDFRDTFRAGALEGPKELPGEGQEEEESPKKGYCHYCGARADLMVLMWDRSGYVGACAECSRKYMDEQYIGSALKEEDPELYEELYKKTHPKFRGILKDPSGYTEIWG